MVTALFGYYLNIIQITPDIEVQNHYSRLITKNPINSGDEISLNSLKNNIICDIMNQIDLDKKFKYKKKILIKLK